MGRGAIPGLVRVLEHADALVLEDHGVLVGVGERGVEAHDGDRTVQPSCSRTRLALATADGRPPVRFVLLKGVDDDGIRFFTNYGSRKARERDANPVAAATLYWLPVARSVRMEGAVERLPPEESDADVESRSRERFPSEIPRPDHWGGYKLRPDAVELWQGRPDRLHDREHFLRAPDGVWRSASAGPPELAVGGRPRTFHS